MEMKKKANLPWITIVLIAINAVVFLIFDLFFYEKQDEITFYMALNPVFVLKQGEYWRLITSMFYHFGIDHLVYNMLILYVMGAMLEPFYGRVCYFILFFASGFAADAASLLYNGVIAGEEGMFSFSAGASGAVYGLIGGFVAIYLFQREVLPIQEKRRLVFAVCFLLFGSIFDTGIGHSAHFGGFFGGIVLGSIYCMRMKKRAEKRHAERMR